MLQILLLALFLVHASVLVDDELKHLLWDQFDKVLFFQGGSPGLVVMGGDSRTKGRGFESQCRILDGYDIFSH